MHPPRRKSGKITRILSLCRNPRNQNASRRNKLRDFRLAGGKDQGNVFMPASHGNGVGARSGCGGRRLYHGEVRAAALLAAAPLAIADESVPLVTAVKLAR